MNNLNFVVGIFHLEVLVVMDVVEVILTITNKFFEATLIYWTWSLDHNRELIFFLSFWYYYLEDFILFFKVVCRSGVLQKITLFVILFVKIIFFKWCKRTKKYMVKTSNNLKVPKLHHIFVFYNCLNLSKMQDYNNEWFQDVLKVT